MKKTIMAVLIVSAMAFSVKADAQRIGFYFYPDLNVYFNTQTHEYAYLDRGTWQYRRNLPPRMRPVGHSYVTVYGNGPEIWRENQIHRDKYRNWDRRHRRQDRRRDERDRH